MGFDFRNLRFGLLIVAFGLGLCGTAEATPYLVIDAKTGEVLAQQDATEPWYPASLTKLVSVYVALKAVQEKRVTFDTPFIVSPRAARMPPSKMGFAPGTEVTLDNLLKMLLVKSANDLAIVLAEGIDGSVQDFAAEMNATAASLGMRESHFVNPNGLHDAGHYSSARDLAIVARALLRDFPEHADLFDIGALKLGDQIIPTHNGLMGRYPGIDGMKTGFTCPAGFNVVASATQGDRKIIAVVLGYPDAKSRSLKAAALLDAGFRSRGTGLQLGALPSSRITTPPNMREAVCGRHREIVAEDDFPIEVAVPGTAQSAASANDDNDSPARFFARSASQPATKTVLASQLLFARRPVFEPIPVFLGPMPGWSGPVMQARATPTAPQGATVPATAAAFAPARSIALGANSPVTVDPSALPLNRSTRGGDRPTASVGASADRAIAEKADAEALRAKSIVKPKTKTTAAAKLHPAVKSGAHREHAHVRPASTATKLASRQRPAKAPVKTSTGSRATPGPSAQ